MASSQSDNSGDDHFPDLSCPPLTTTEDAAPNSDDRQQQGASWPNPWAWRTSGAEGDSDESVDDEDDDDEDDEDDDDEDDEDDDDDDEETGRAKRTTEYEVPTSMTNPLSSMATSPTEGEGESKQTESEAPPLSIEMTSSKREKRVTALRAAARKATKAAALAVGAARAFKREGAKGREKSEATSFAVDSMIEVAGTGFYSMATVIVVRGTESLRKQVAWTLGAFLLLFMQIISIFGLLANTIMPLCTDTDSCGYPGFFCANIRDEKTGFDAYQSSNYPFSHAKPFCLECRLVVCTSQFSNGTTNFGGTFADDTDDVVRGSAYCEEQVDHVRGANTINSCYPIYAAREIITSASFIIVIVVAIAVGLSLMSEKKQVVVQMRILQMALSEAGCRTGYSLICARFARHCCCCWKYCCCCWKYCCRCCYTCCVDCCEVKTREGTHTLHQNVGFSEWREQPNASFSNWREVDQRNSVRLFLIYILSMNHYFRQNILLGLFPVTVANLLLFNGADPLNALLNGVAVVFLIDIDDVIGEVVFTSRYREKASSRIKTALRKYSPDVLYNHLKFDQASGIFVCVVTVFIILYLFALIEPESSYRSGCVTMVGDATINSLSIYFAFFSLETLIHHEYFYAKFGWPKESETAEIRNGRKFFLLFRKRFKGACVRLLGLGLELSLALGVAFALLLLVLYLHNGKAALSYYQASWYPWKCMG